MDEGSRLEAVERLVGGQAPAGGEKRALAERFVDFSNSNRIRIDSMWARLDEAGGIAATVLAVPNPGRTAILFASAIAGPDDVGLLAPVIEQACRELSAADVDLAQVLLEPHDALLREAFAAGGFRPLARLSYMERPLPGRRKLPAPAWPGGVSVEPYREEHRDEVLEVLESSYRDTLDCPGLRGLRRTSDILAGHAGTGDFDPDLWTIMRSDGQASGVLLLNPAPTSGTIELVYIGLAAIARGRGLGRLVLRHGLRLVMNRPERAMTLAVDDNNAPAIALYRSEGFRCVLRREAMICPLRPAGADGRDAAP